MGMDGKSVRYTYYYVYIWQKLFLATYFPI